MNKPTLLVEVVFLSAEDGGRQSVPVFGTQAEYRPHLVVQDRTVRRARMIGNTVDERYLGVSFLDGPQQFGSGETIRCVLRLNFFPDVDYAELAPGTPFTVREGARVVAHGVVLERRDAG
jgi:hypothetical protein